MHGVNADAGFVSRPPVDALTGATEAEIDEFEPLLTHMSRWLRLRDDPSHTLLRKQFNAGLAPVTIQGPRTKVEAIVAQRRDAL